MSITLTVKGHKQMQIDISGIVNATKRGIRRGLYRAGKSLKATANKNILEKPKSGRTYFIKRGRSGRRFRHVASSPGESFANRSGAARRTLGYDVRGSSQLEFGFRGNAETEYTKILEESLNRPTLTIAVRQNERNIIKHLENAIRKELI